MHGCFCVCIHIFHLCGEGVKTATVVAAVAAVLVAVVAVVAATVVAVLAVVVEVLSGTSRELASRPHRA